MKITCDRNVLAGALGVAGHAVSGRSTVPILSHVKLETADDHVKITGTDLDTTIRCTIAAQVAENGAVAIPAGSLIDYVSRLPDAPVTLDLEDGKVKVRSGSSRFTILSSPAEDFPLVPEVSTGTEISVTAATLKDMLRMTAFAASREEARSQLMGVLFEVRGSTLTLVATDTHRLAWKQATLAEPVETPVTITVPAKPLIELERMLKNTADEMVTIRFSPLQVQFQTPDAILVSRVLEGAFPNYEKVIPKDAQRKIKFEREELLNAVRRVDIVARANSQKMLLKTNGDRVTLSSESPEAGQAYEEVPVSMDGDDLTIAFNSRYLMEVLGLIGMDQVRLELNGPLNPGILRAGEDFLYVVMPMQA